MIRQPYLILGLLFFVCFNCKSLKIDNGIEANYNLSTKQLIKENLKQTPDFNTLQSKLKITYTQKGSSQSHSVSFRAKKDEKLWISATFSIIRALVTPEKVSFYNKLDNTYFEGGYSYLNKILGTELDFEKVQNLLFGEALYNLNKAYYKASVRDSSYVLKQKKTNEIYDILFLLSPSNFKVKSQQISQPKEFRHLQIDYLSHQEIEKQTIPKKIKVVAAEGKDEVVVDLDFKNVSLNDDLKFPFKIPTGYNKIEL